MSKIKTSFACYFLLLLLLAVVLFFLLKYKSNELLKIKVASFAGMGNNINFAILFTCYNSEKNHKRINDILHYYVKILKFPRDKLFLVDSSNNGVSTDYIYLKNQVVFDQAKKCKQLINVNKPGERLTYFELCSLEKCKTLDFGNVNYIFKLTTKYKLPEILNIDTSKFHVDFIIQNKFTAWILTRQHCELFGIRKDIFNKMIDTYLNEYIKNKNSFEEIILKNLNKNNSLRLPRLKNIAIYKRNDGRFLSYL